jgi:hypothetical protein
MLLLRTHLALSLSRKHAETLAKIAMKRVSTASNPGFARWVAEDCRGGWDAGGAAAGGGRGGCAL